MNLAYPFALAKFRSFPTAVYFTAFVAGFFG
jgi:hypothetical protein